MLIVNVVPQDEGWTPVQHMVSIAARMLEAEIVVIGEPMPSRIRQLLSVVKRREQQVGDELCLMVCAGPGDLLKIVQVCNWRKRFKFIAAWIIDSFWREHISSIVRISNPFDHFFVTTVEDVDLWKSLTGVPTSWLPWGADVLGGVRLTADRQWDITRVGRQPLEWADDAETLKESEALGIRFRGRPFRAATPIAENHRFLMDVYGNSKFILAFSNSVNPEIYTHPTRQYLTGRWVDSLGCGATVAGIRPRSETADELLWPEATLEFPNVQRGDGLAVLAGAIASWTPDIAAQNHRIALRKLDWRWRFHALANHFRINPGVLANELKELKGRVASLERSIPAP